MAEHTFIKSDKYVSLGLAALYQMSVLPNFFKRVGGDIFKGAKNDTVNWVTGRVTTARDYEWRTRTEPIVLDKIGQTQVDIKLDTHLYQGVPLTNEQMTLDVKTFAREIVEPQVSALVARAEGKVVSGLRSADFKTPMGAFTEEDDPYKWALRVRQLLNSQGAPRSGRAFLVGAAVENWLLGSDRIAPPNVTPEQSRAIREAQLGRLAGFDIIPVPALEDDEVFAVTSDALIVANVAPERPRGAPQSARQAADGWSLLHTFGYQEMYQQDTSILSTFMGVNSVNDELQVERDADTKLPKLVLDDNGDPIPTGKNVRGTYGRLTEA